MPIKLDYTTLEEKMSKMGNCSLKLEEVFADMKDTVSSLVEQGYMEAETATACINEFDTIMAPDLGDLVDLIDEYKKQLKQICEAFQNADKALTSLFS